MPVSSPTLATSLFRKHKPDFVISRHLNDKRRQYAAPPKRRETYARSAPWQAPSIQSGIMHDFRFRRSEEHTSELQSLMRISYAVFCLKKKKMKIHNTISIILYIDMQ